MIVRLLDARGVVVATGSLPDGGWEIIQAGGRVDAPEAPIVAYGDSDLSWLTRIAEESRLPVVEDAARQTHQFGDGGVCVLCRCPGMIGDGGYCATGALISAASEASETSEDSADVAPEETEKEPAQFVVADAPRMFLAEEQICALDAAAGWQPSADQAHALQVLRDLFAQGPCEAVLTGAAGSGKTTVLLALLRALSPACEVVLLAPTWRAANRMSDVTGKVATSLHKAVYGSPVEERLCTCGAWTASLLEPEIVDVEVQLDAVPDTTPGATPAAPVTVKLPRYQCSACKALHEDATRFPTRLSFQLKERGSDEAPPPYRLVVCDEAGMVAPADAKALRRAFVSEETRILWVGDPNQLSWVSEEGADHNTADAPDLLHPTVALHNIHRQKGGSPAVALAHTLKTVPEVSTVQWPFPRRFDGIDIQSSVPLDVPAQWAARLRCASEDVALICFSNRTRATLNNLVRHYSGALHAGNGALIPGDRLLARANSPMRLRRAEFPVFRAPVEVRNGEVWTVLSAVRVEAKACLLGENGRATRSKPHYEHDRVLEEGVAVLRITAMRLGGGAPQDLLLVLPQNGAGQPLCESALIRQGAEPGKARQRIREVAMAWAEEYVMAIADREGEFLNRQGLDRDWRVGLAGWLRYARSDRKLAKTALLRMEKASGVTNQRLAIVAQLDLGAFADMAEVDLRAVVEQAFPNRAAGACEIPDVYSYCRQVYDALDVGRVAIFDEGEAGTCHSWQGGQANSVGVVFDAAFWGAWRNNRLDALRWCYTADTRAVAHLAQFGIKKAQ